MGLLDRALIVDKKEETFSPDVGKMMNSLQLISAGIEFPSILFSHIVKEFHITKGALLLPQENLSFVPWAETGFDRTTSRRIRIPEILLDGIKENESYNFIELKNSEIDILKDYFSFREYSVTESVTIIPLIADDQIIAILLICSGDILNLSSEAKLTIFNNLSDSAAPLLFSKRESVFSKFELITDNEVNIDKAVGKFINNQKNSSFLLLSISLEEFIRFMRNKDSNAIAFRLKQDILRLVKTLIAENGEVINGTKDSLIILLKASRIAEAEMFVHQIGLSLSYFYKISTSDFKPDFHVKKYPEDGNTAEELTAELL